MKNIVSLLLFFIPVFLKAQTKILPPTIEWQKSLGGSKADKAYTVIPTLDHGYLVVGLSFSNDGQVTGHHGTTDSSDAWVVKLNSAGSIEWQKSYGGSNTDEFRHAIQTSNGDFICIGTTRSVDGDVTGLHNGGHVASDLWAVRINRDGVIQWSKVFGGSEEEHGQVIRKTPDGNYIIGGDAQSNDFDVTGNHGAADIWILKINEQGTLLWQKTFGNANAQYVTSITVTNNNNYLISGYQEYKGYPAQPPGVVVMGVYEAASVKTDAQGNSLWEKFPLFSTGPLGQSAFVSRIFELPSGNLFSAGNYLNTYNTLSPDWTFGWLNSSNGNAFQSYNSMIYGDSAIADYTYPRNAGPEAYQMLSDSSVLSCLSFSNNTAALNRISSNYPPSSFIYQKIYSLGIFNGVISLGNDEYIAAGSIAISPGTGNDFLVVKFNAQNQIKGKVFIDNNGNGVKDAGEPFFTKGFVESRKNGKVISSAIDTSGSFLNPVDTGTFTTTMNLGGSSIYYTINPASKQSVFTAYNKKDSFSFALVPVGPKNDLQISLQSISTMRPGFDAGYRIDYSNKGTVAISNTVIKLVKPAVTSFVSASRTPSAVTADTIAWNIGNLSPGDIATITLLLKSNPPPAVNIGDVMVLSATIQPVTGDETPADNKDTLTQTVRGSFDPNDKLENHNGTFYMEQLQANQPLTYTIRFQNTGTDTAFNVEVRDTLSDQLDVSSLEIVSASHPAQFNLKDNKFGTWTFNNILLPAMATNEPASHGYITYHIKPKSSLQVGDKIYNSASIYFDYNLPVKTNTQETVITPTPVPAPSQPVVSGLQLNYCKALGAQIVKITNLPAASSGITVTAKLDATVLTIGADSTVSFTVSTLTAGPHNLTVTYSNATATKTTTAGFTVTAAATPDVNLTASTTNVTNLANPVVVTATNASGGGKSPQYTFAWNNSFTNIAQAQSSNNILNIDASSLALGDNKVFVKMKTSEDCYTVQTNIDSITIRRDMSTGITDVDFPGQVIAIYPNPVNGPVTINGLSTAKTYTFTIVNLQGQVVLSKRVANQSTTTIRDFNGRAGIYWLTVYDEKRNRPLGSVKLVKQ